MASLEGVHVPPPLLTGGVTPSAVLADGALAASVTQVVEIIDVVTRSHTGARLPAFGAEWLDRLQVDPSYHDFGIVRQARETEVRLYNAGTTAETIDSVDGENAEGIFLTDVSLPVTVPARTSVAATLVGDPEGPDDIDGRLLISGAESVGLLLVVGERIVLEARVFPLAPNTAGPVIESWQWRTDVQRAKAGDESRRAIYAHPRRGLEYRVILDDVMQLDRLLSGWQTQQWTVPRWMDRTVLTAPAAQDAELIELDTTLGDWRAGGQVVLMGKDRWEAPLVSAVNAGSLELETPLLEGWPAGSVIYPGRRMRMPTSISVERPTAGVLLANVSLLADQDVETNYTAADSETEFDGSPVYLVEPNRARDAAAGYERAAVRVDSGVGVILLDDPDRDPIHTHEWEYLFDSRAAIDSFIAWLFAREGRAHAFWYPTWSSDLDVISDIQPEADSVTVRPIEWTRWYAERPNRGVIAIETRSGQWLFARVTESNLAGAIEVLNLDRALLDANADPVPVAAVRRACWLERVRLDTDRVEVAWHTDTVADTRLRLTGIRAS